MVVFCFSKKRCDSLVDSLASLDLTSADDKSDIQVLVFQTAATAFDKPEHPASVPKEPGILLVVWRHILQRRQEDTPASEQAQQHVFCSTRRLC